MTSQYDFQESLNSLKDYVEQYGHEFEDSAFDEVDLSETLEIESLFEDSLEEQTDSNDYSISVKMFIDTEYTDTESLSVQMYVLFEIEKIQYQLRLVVINEKYISYFPQSLIDDIALKEKIYVLTCDMSTDTKTIALNAFIQAFSMLKIPFDFSKYSRVNFKTLLYLFYQVKDMSISFGFENMKPFYNMEAGSIATRRGLSGSFSLNYAEAGLTCVFSFYIRDLSTLENATMQKMLESVGESVVVKSSMDQYKSNMLLAIINDPEGFILYGFADAYNLYTILTKKIESYNFIMTNTFGIPTDQLFTLEKFPLTLGAIVSYIWTKFLNNNVFKNDLFILLSLIKQGVLNEKSKHYGSNLEGFKILQEIKSKQELENHFKHKTPESVSMLRLLNSRSPLRFSIFQYASIKFLVAKGTLSTLPLLASRTGGRTNNERPQEYIISLGLDVDISSAYGSQLVLLTYPIGRPRMYAKTPNDLKKLTLRGFLKKYEHNLKLGLWKLVVSGKLSFSQDIVYSRILDLDTVMNKPFTYSEERPTTAIVQGQLVLLRNEIQHGTITNSILETLKKVCTTQELKEFYELELECAMFWLDSDRVDSVEELAEISISDRGSFEYDVTRQVAIDNRHFKWYGIELSEFINPLLQKRLQLKKQNDKVSVALQNSLKNVINTYWGILTSVFFPLNNVVVSDIVTANIRVAAWKMSKAFNSYLTVTDGGPYSPTQVNYIKSKKLPGMNILSSHYDLIKHASIKVQSLGEGKIDWETLYNSHTSPYHFPNVDDLANKHLKDFWSSYNLPIDFKIEHKLENTFLRGSYIMKSHYCFLIYNSETGKYDKKYPKVRGVSKRDIANSNIKVNPIYYLLDSMLDLKTNFSFDYSYQSTSLLSLADYRRNLIKENGQKKCSLEVNPGDLFLKQHQFRLNNTYTFLPDAKTYKTRDRRSTRFIQIFENGKPVKTRMYLFEKFFFTESIDQVIRRINQDNLR